jgi:hypothetical protein
MSRYSRTTGRSPVNFRADWSVENVEEDDVFGTDARNRPELSKCRADCCFAIAGRPLGALPSDRP